MQSTIKHKIFGSSFVRILLGLLLCFATFILAQQLVNALLDLTTISNNWRNLIKGIIASALVLYVYLVYYRKVEKRGITELTGNGLLKNISLGVLIGTLVQSLTLVTIYLFGGLEIISVNPLSFIITPFVIALSVATFEEILLRGIIFRIAEEKLGSWISLLLSALIFGAVHLMNPDSSLISSICTGLVGFVLGAAYIYSRSLWFPIAIHFSWNFVQSGVFGAITSGNEKTSSLFTTNISGSELITGGSFGPEGTIQATLFWLTVAIIATFVIVRENKMIKPFWKTNSKSIGDNIYQTIS